MVNSSALSRILSASIASWVRIGVTVITQVALIPIYLKSWSVETYGAWILVQALWAMVISVDVAHHDFIGYECLNVKATESYKLSLIISSAFPVAYFIAIWDVILVWQIGRADFILQFISSNADLINQCRTALIYLAITWLFTGFQIGLINRWIIPLGYNANVTWLAALSGGITAISPAIAVFYGANLLNAAIALCLSNFLFSLANYIYMWRISRILKLRLVKPNLNYGIKRGLLSLWLALKSFMEMFRQQGIRLLLAPLVGTNEMVGFSTMRTCANFALQGLNTITGPVMPEMMGFIVAREQHRLEGTFAIVWLVLCGGLAPCVIGMQYLAPIFFPLWTHNKINFDPWLFGVLSMTVLVFGLSQPALAIIQGKNSLKPQLIISIVGALLVLLGIIFITPIFGIRGAASVILFSEVCCLLMSIWFVSYVLRDNKLYWPWRNFRIVAMSVVTVGISLIIQENISVKLSLFWLGISISIQIVFAIWYWSSLSQYVRNRAVSAVNKGFNFKTYLS